MQTSWFRRWLRAPTVPHYTGRRVVEPGLVSLLRSRSAIMTLTNCLQVPRMVETSASVAAYTVADKEAIMIQGSTHRMIHKSLLVLALAVMILSASRSVAIPAFSRMYGTSCSTCNRL